MADSASASRSAPGKSEAVCMSAPMPSSSTEIGRCGAMPSASASSAVLGLSARRHKAAPAAPPPPGPPAAARAEAACWTGGCLRAPSVRRSETRRHWPSPGPPPTACRRSAPASCRPARRGSPCPRGAGSRPVRPRCSSASASIINSRSGYSTNFIRADLPPAPPVAVHQHQRILRPAGARIIVARAVAPRLPAAG